MASTHFTDKVTMVPADWANDVNALVYDVFQAAQTTAQAVAVLGLTNARNQQFDTIAVTGGAINATPIGLITPAAGAFTSLTVTKVTPTLDQDVASKAYVDANVANIVNMIISGQLPIELLNAKVNKSGDTMTGALILNTATPTNSLAAAPKAYVDTQAGAVQTSLQTLISNLATATVGSPQQGAGLIGYRGQTVWTALDSLLVQSISPNVVYAGPTAGSGTPAFRALVIADLPFAGQPNGVATLDTNGKIPASQIPGGGGSVTSVDLSMPSAFTVSGGPITSAGTFTVNWANVAQHLFLSGPATGAASAPTFRAIQSTDLPLASSTSAGAVQIGTGLAGTSGVISIDPTTNVTTFNTRVGAITLLGSDITAAGGALLASPAFTGNPTAPTQLSSDNSTKIATTAYVQSVIGSLGQPATTTSLGVVQIGSGLAITVGGLLSANMLTVAGRTGNVVLTVADVSGAAPLASPAFTGVPTAPTAASGDNSTTLATTAFVYNKTSGVQTVNVAGSADVSLTTAQAGSGILLLSGALTGNINLIVPSQGANYTIYNGSTGNFTVTVKTAGAGTTVMVVQGQTYKLMCDGTNVRSAGATSSTFFQRFPFTATAGQTTFNVTYTPGALIVAVNGSTISGANYTASTGTTVVFNTAMSGTEEVEFFVWTAFQVANALTLGGGTMSGPIILTGNDTTVTQATSDNSTKLATTAFVQNVVATAAPLKRQVITVGNIAASGVSNTDLSTYGFTNQTQLVALLKVDTGSSDQYTVQIIETVSAVETVIYQSSAQTGSYKDAIPFTIDRQVSNSTLTLRITANTTGTTGTVATLVSSGV